MPLTNPKKSGRHRHACLALYRALLRQVTASSQACFPTPSLPDAVAGGKIETQEMLRWVSVLTSAVQCQFRDCASLQSFDQITGALNQGYEALHLLRSLPSPLDGTSSRRLIADIDRLYMQPLNRVALPDEQKRAAMCYDHPGQSPSGKANSGPRVWRHPSTSANRPHILARPLPRSDLSGKRHVPRLVTALSTPFLQIKKPQPPYLSRIIRDHKVKHQKRIDLLREVREWWIPLSHAEDRWETEMLRACNEEGDHALRNFKRNMSGTGVWEDKSHFRQSGTQAHDAVYNAIAAAKTREKAWAKELWDILQAERKLKLEEEGVLVPLMGPNPERKKEIALLRWKEKQKFKLAHTKQKTMRNAE